jgi:IS605 OrfB family transposase
MKTVLTISCKLQIQNEQVIKLKTTLTNFAAACNWINQSVDPKLTNNVRIQALTYEQIRQQFGLSANLAIRAINRVAGNRKTAKHKGKPVKEFQPTSADIVLENLAGIRERTNQLPRSKKERRLSNSWSFFELRFFISYKSLAAGVDVVLVDPRYTSKTCHCCQVIGERKGKSFKCINTACNWYGDADYNGATNIKKLGAVLVSQPRGSELFCSLEQVVLGLPKVPTIPQSG